MSEDFLPDDIEAIEGDDLFEHYRFKADLGQNPLRIDKFLLDRIPDTSRNKLQVAAKSGYIMVNGVGVKQNYRVKGGDVVTMELPHPVREFELIPEQVDFEVVFEDDYVLVLNKPAGLVVHPGHGNYTGTLVNGLLHHFGQAQRAVELEQARPGLVHRIDKLTTGLMVIAKTEKGMMHLSNQFFERTVERRYNALVWGDVADEGSVTGNIGRSLKNRKLMEVFPNGDYGKHAITHYKVLQRFGYITFVECKLETGRTHQIRVHMKHIGHPLFNDIEYGGDKVLKGPGFSRYRQFIDNCFSDLPRQALHARTLGFEHPYTGERMHFTSELPEDMKTVIAKWERYVPSAEH
jgi:23S rRNA pseudouridine1911/1915/1917 synthase